MSRSNSCHSCVHHYLWHPTLRVQYCGSSDALWVCRFWPEGRVRLWEEKLQLRKAFAGNAATQWGTVQEDVALKCYSEVCTRPTCHTKYNVMQN